MINRRGFLKLSVAAMAGALLASKSRFLPGPFQGSGVAMAALSPQVPMPAAGIPQFVDEVPNLLGADSLIVDDGVTTIELEMVEHQTQVLPTGMPKTTVWSYLKPGQGTRTSYLGPVVLATRGVPTEMKFVNKLGSAASTNLLAYKYGTDQTLHWADPLHDEENMWNHMAMPPAVGSEGAENYQDSIPAVVHLHGGEVPPVLDGGPDAWVTSDGAHKGHGFYSRDGAEATNYHTYRYPNSQEGALIWFHDHTLGATRLNVYAGLAGGYLIADPDDPTLAKLPTLFPLVIQDRMFDMQGEFFFPSATAGGVLWALNPEHPYWVPEFVGDTIVVNGKTWPFMNVEPRRYTFMFINGSNARGYEMFLTDPVSGNPGPALWVIATDGGYLDAPVKIDPTALVNNKLVMLGGERYWVIVDFANFPAGMLGPNGLPYSGQWILRNTAKTPFPGGGTALGGTTGKLMKFVVAGGPVTDTSYDPATLAPLRTPMVRLTGAAIQQTRQLTLNEVMGMPQIATDPVTGVPVAYPGGPLEILVNNTKWSGERITGVDNTDPMMPMYTMEPIPGFTLDQLKRNYLSELPNEGETELWEIVNLTADAHPIHLHLVQFQLLNRQNFDTAKYGADYALAFPGGGWNNMPVPPAQPGPYPAGVYIPGFGPPLAYVGDARAGGKLGGNLDVGAKNAKGKFLYLKGVAAPALPQESGWKDTVVMYPGQVTRILVRWAPTDLPANTPPENAYFPFDPRANGGGYVWHCHIVDHEDNEMMRPDEVVPNANGNANRTYVQGVDY